MFGEDDSESPRVASPWDVFSTPPSSSPPITSTAIPRLVPEAEEGNIEYKLQLLHPSEARFTRLVTQLKWRLLEGGGQCYYELGVADDGALVGLPRADLEASLETLEMMAGEIGASVIVVKEVEIPAVMAGLAGSNTDRWNGKRQHKRDALMRASASPSEGESTTTGGSTTETDVTDVEEDKKPSHIRVCSFDPLFAMDPELDVDLDDNAPFSAVDLEIASVFKPRPMRKRILHPVHAHTARDVEPKVHKRRGPGKNRTRHVPRIQHDVIESLPAAAVPAPVHLQQTKGQAKAENRKYIRDKRREDKRRALLSYAGFGGQQADDDREEDDEGPPKTVPLDGQVKGLLSGLESLHVSVKEHPTHVPVTTMAHPLSGVTYFESEYDVNVDDNEPDVEINNFTLTPGPYSGFNGVGEGEAVHGVSRGPAARLIVEALVVRKLSLDEGFLDFGGFSLM